MSIFSNNRLLSIVTLALLVVNIFTLVLLWKHKNIEPPHMGNNQLPPQQLFEFVTKELALNDSQQNAYKLLRVEHQKGQKNLQENIKMAKDSFYALLKNDLVSDTLLSKENNKVAKAIAEIDLYNFKHFQLVRAICTAEQKIKFDAILKEIFNRMGNGRRPPPPFNNKDRGNRPPPPLDKEGNPPPM